LPTPPIPEMTNEVGSVDILVLSKSTCSRSSSLDLLKNTWFLCEVIVYISDSVVVSERGGEADKAD
jgi:hypothetical protein